MKERCLFFYIVSLAGVTLSFFLSRGAMAEWGMPGNNIVGVLGYTDADGRPMMLIPFMAEYSTDLVMTIIFMLAAIVLVNIVLLLSLLKRNTAGRIAGLCAFVITVWAAGPASLPMASATALSVFGISGAGTKKLTTQSVVFYMIWIIICWTGPMVIISSVVLLGFSIYIYRLMERGKRLEELAEDSVNKADEIREMLGSQRRMIKSMEHVSRLEERNRLAARIHDEIGHGMSGSILLLEGAEMVMESEPEKAHETIQKVTENLRDSVEKIRKVLREERSLGAEVNLARIKNELAAFESNYSTIKTRLETQGNMEEINSAVWVCIYENMIEAMTNMLKHTSATQFLVSLKNSAGLLHVEFSDNGGPGWKSTATGEKGSSGIPAGFGIGLQNMEERAAICYGRCFFRHDSDGFHIVMTFPRKGGN